MKTLFWLAFRLLVMPQILNYLSDKWEIIFSNVDIFAGILTCCILISFSISKWYYSGIIDSLKETNSTLKETGNTLKESNNTVSERLKAKDEEIFQLKEKINNSNECKTIEAPKNKTIKELSNKEIASITNNLVKQIQNFIQEWEDYNKKNNPTETDKAMLLMNEYFSKYLDNTIILKRELSSRIYPDKTELIEGYYIGASEKDKIFVVCKDLTELAKKVNTKDEN